MAKTCEVCNQTYPDILTHCPHCAAREHAAEHGEDAIDWLADESAIVEDEHGEESPFAHEQSVTPQTEETAVPPASGQPEETLVIDWNAVDQHSSASPAPETAGMDLGALEDLAADEHAAPISHEPHDAAPATPHEEGAHQPPQTEMGTPTPMPWDAEHNLPADDDDAAIDMNRTLLDDGSSINLGQGLAGLSEFPSEEPVRRTPPPVPEETPSGHTTPTSSRRELQESTIFDEDFGALGGQDETSAVDLGSSPDVHVPEGGQSEVNSIHGANEDIESPQSDVALGEELASAEGEGEPSAATFDFEEAPADEPPAPPAPRARRSRGGLMQALSGAVVGALVASAGWAGAWKTGMLPGSTRNAGSAPPAIVSTAQQPSAPPSAAPPSTAPAAVPQPAAAPSEDARTYLDRGDFDRLLQQSQAAEHNAERLAQRGEARWLLYLQQQKQKNAPLKADDPPVKQAKADLEASRSADGLFWLGQIQESTGDIAGARKTYESAMQQYKSNPNQSRLFQAALDRIEDTSGETPAGGQSGQAGERQWPALDFSSAVASLALEELLAVQPPSTPPVRQSKAQPAPAAQAPATKSQPPAPQPAAKTEPTAAPAAAPKSTPPSQAQQAPATAAEPEEAGFAFWRAVRLARHGEYDQAIDALKEARAAHEARRFLRLRRSQNPSSDPTEEIFLRSCDELQTAWQLEAKLHGAGLLTSNRRGAPAQAVDKLLSEYQASKNSALSSEVADKLKQDKDVAQADPEGKNPNKKVSALLEAKQKADAKLSALQALLARARPQGSEPEDISQALEQVLGQDEQLRHTLSGISKALASANVSTGDQPSALADAVQKLVEQSKSADEKFQTTTGKLNEAETTIKAIAQKLASANLVPPNAHGAELIKGIDNATAGAGSPAVTALATVVKDLIHLTGGIARGLLPPSELAARLAESPAGRVQRVASQGRSPEQMLDIWLEVLKDRGQTGFADRALADATIVANQSAAAEKGKALCVEGLALRNSGKAAEARQVLKEALNNSSGGESNWKPEAEQALAGLNDAGAYYLPEAWRLKNAGKLDQALAVLNAGITAFQGDEESRVGLGRLFAERSLVELELAHADAGAKQGDARSVQSQATKDANAAVEAGAKAEGHFALGRIAEQLGNRRDALREYRLALNEPSGDPRYMNHCRIALARVLVGMAGEQGRQAPRAPAPEESSSPAPAGTEQHGRLGTINPAMLLVGLLVMDGPPEAGAAAGTDLDEAVRLADQAIHAGDNEGYFVKAEALAKKGLWTDGVMTYLQGLEHFCSRPSYISGLRYLIENHPAFHMPDVAKSANPLLSEHYYALGLDQYWSGNFAAAEKDFAMAVQYAGQSAQDARPLYYLGLAQLKQGYDKEAFEAFRRGSALERQNQPPSATVNSTLERVQGEPRRILNSFRP